MTLDKLNFNYHLEGDDAIKPERVYNDGQKTIIELPQKVFSSGQLPALLCVSQSGGFFSADKLSTVNYRLQGRRFVLDGVPEKLRLLSGAEDGLRCDITLQEQA